MSGWLPIFGSSFVLATCLLIAEEGWDGVFMVLFGAVVLGILALAVVGAASLV